MMRVHVLTLFPGLFDPFLREGIVGIARDKGLLDVQLVDFRRFTTDRHRSVDDRPFGGGPGMLLKPEPIFAAVERIEARIAPLPSAAAAAEPGESDTNVGERVGERPGPRPPVRKIMLTPQGRPLDQALVTGLAREPELLLLCGRYEGFDERIRLGMAWEELSLGDFVLSGGEVAALALIDALSRLIPGAVGHPDSTRLESFEDGLLDYPQYTRPRSFRGMDVPDILLSGDHARIDRWRRDEALRRTRDRRHDLLSRQPYGFEAVAGQAAAREAPPQGKGGTGVTSRPVTGQPPAERKGTATGS